MKEIGLATLGHLVLCAKQIQEIANDFSSIETDDFNICSLVSERVEGVPTLHVQPGALAHLSMLANQQISLAPLYFGEAQEVGSFTYSGVKFYALFDPEEVEAYHAENP